MYEYYNHWFEKVNEAQTLTNKEIKEYWIYGTL
jgi:hypothetical protein